MPTHCTLQKQKCLGRSSTTTQHDPTAALSGPADAPPNEEESVFHFIFKSLQSNHARFPNLAGVYFGKLQNNPHYEILAQLGFKVSYSYFYLFFSRIKMTKT